MKYFILWCSDLQQSLATNFNDINAIISQCSQKNKQIWSSISISGVSKQTRDVRDPEFWVRVGVPTHSGIAKVTRCWVFFCLIFLALLVYSSSMMLLTTFKILLKSPQLTIMCGWNSEIWMFFLLWLWVFFLLGFKSLSSYYMSLSSNTKSITSL